MRIYRWIMLLGGSLLAGACAPAAPPANNSSIPGIPAVASPEATPKDAASAADNSIPAPPEGALYTLYCGRFTGPNRAADAARVKADLIKYTPLKAWYVINTSDSALLYYGYYKSYDQDSDPQEKKRAQDDKNAVQSIVRPDHTFPFAAAMFVELASPDPEAPPEWDLRNASGYWTVEIAVYKDSPKRKQAAVDAVREARAMGVDAYYYHGPTISSVCIGHWPKEAVKEIAAPRVSPDKIPVYIPYDWDQTKAPREVVGPNGQVFVPVQVKVEIQDPTIRQTLDKYPEHCINGSTSLIKVKNKDGSETAEEVPSSLVKMPGRDDARIDDNPVLKPDDTGVDSTAAQQESRPSDTGRLRSIGP